MINLIPPTAKKKILVEYWVRVISVWLILWALALFTAASILLPAYVLIGLQVKAQQESAELASQKVADYDTVSKVLVKASQQAKMIVDEARLPRFSAYALLFERLQGEEIEIMTVRIGRDDKGLTPAVVGGVASDRQALASFRDRLLAEESVTKVDLPISNLARDKDIPFTITVTLVNPDAV